jgi:hypothetical protein
MAHGGGRPIVPSRVTMVTIESDASVSGQSCGGAIVEERLWKSDCGRVVGEERLWKSGYGRAVVEER